MCYKSHLRFPVGNSLHASGRRTGLLPELQPSRPMGRPDLIHIKSKMTEKKHRNFYVHARLDQEEYSRFRTLMEIGGYTSISCFLRDLIAQKRLPYRQEMAHISPRQLSDKVNVLIYQVNKIGINYNQVVATWQKQSRQTRPDGTPYLNTYEVEERLTELMRLTEGLRDEFAVILDVIKKYIGESPNTSTI